ncbi:Xylanase inhibitor, C-terminal [Dillenia turbinata]|uniref:Xylanase inhibitor, C-terminal n=1 Tax=Dillenia turbinata TaxID=194707 RepID=A0AAN8ZE54_9MAGN
MMLKSTPITLLFLFFFSGHAFSSASFQMHFELLHRHSPKLDQNTWPKTKITQQERFKDLLQRDGIRQKVILHKLTLRRKAWDRETPTPSNASGSAVSVEMEIHSGADYGIGEYFVEFKVGTPSQKFMLIADTGSDLTWMNCKYRRSDTMRRRLHHGRVFHAERSSSFKTVPCLSEMCKVELMNLFSLARCPTPLTPCAYDFRYFDGSAALGIFANETITVGLTNGRKTRLHDVLIGCSESFRGQSFQGADGVLGLGFSKYSFSFKAAKTFGGIFSYCLVDHLSHKNVSNYLTFGSNDPKNKPNGMQFTKLVLGVLTPFYAVNIIGISVGAKMLEIPAAVWDVNGVGGTILDSGTSLTFLAVPAYIPVMSALKESLVKFKKLEVDIGPLKYCFNSTGFEESVVPKLRFHFTDEAKLEPPVKSYVIDAADGVKCLGFVSTAWPGVSVIGNIMQQNHLWEFDLVQSNLGFYPSTCTLN